MVFSPSGGAASGPSAEEVLDAQLEAKLARARTAVHPPTNGSRRLAWRAIVHTRDRNTVITEWHLAGCSAPGSAAMHCPEGRRLLLDAGEPAGHCLVDGRCGLCGTGSN